MLRANGSLVLISFEVLHALVDLVLRLAKLVLLLLQMVVGTAKEGGHSLELAVEIFPILPVPDLDVQDQAFGHKMHLLAEAFHQDAGVALDLFDPLIQQARKAMFHRLKAMFHCLKAPVYRLKTLIHCLKARIDGLKTLVDCVKTSVEVLNQFLIHTASAH